MEEKKKDVIDLREITKKLWNKKRLFLKVWAITFVLACIWILPQPRYYTCVVKLAPEIGGEDVGGGLSSLASSFGFNLEGIGGQDAIYPELYPELFEDPSFITGLYKIRVSTKDGDISTDYFTYIKQYQKANPLTKPFYAARRIVKSWFEEEDNTPRGEGAEDINPFLMNRADFDLMQKIISNFICSVDTKNRVISIKVTDQDPLVCATMADSVKCHLQDFIIRYRTSKVREDELHYQLLRDRAEEEYYQAMKAYSRFCDTHKNAVMQAYQSERERLESQMAFKQNAFAAMETQLQSTRVKLQEKTPAFTTLKNSIVPVKPAGPKRMLFVLFTLILSTIVTSIILLKEDLKKLMVIYGNRE